MNAARFVTTLIIALAAGLMPGLVPAAGPAKVQTLPRLERPFTAPNFSLPGEDGKTYRLSDYRGKVVLLNFWATWCPPCRYEMPSMERAHQKTQGEDIAILAVNVGEDETTVFAFTAQYPVTFPLPLDADGRVIAQYPVIGLPTTFIIDPRGVATHRAVGGREWDDDRLLDALRGMLMPTNKPEGTSR